jgi:hypothetical protein
MDNKKQGEKTKEPRMSKTKSKGRVSLPTTRRGGTPPVTRRPPNNSNMPMNKIEQLSYEFNETKTELETYASAFHKITSTFGLKTSTFHKITSMFG